MNDNCGGSKTRRHVASFVLGFFGALVVSGCASSKSQKCSYVPPKDVHVVQDGGFSWYVPKDETNVVVRAQPSK